MLCPKCGMAMACQMDFVTGDIFGITLHCINRDCNPNHTAVVIHAAAILCRVFVGNDLITELKLSEVRDRLILTQ